MKVSKPDLLTKKNGLPDWIDLPAVLLFVGLGSLWVSTFHTPMQFDEDEGINLMKSLLLKHGFKLYEQIWSDQPPLFTYLYRWWADCFGWTVNSGRVLVLLFSGLLLLSATRLTKLLSGSTAAGWIACLLILGARKYLRLSVSVMIGLPAIAVALTALWMWVSAVRRSSLLLSIMAGVVLALSMQIKLYTFIMLPAFAVAALIRPQRSSSESTHRGSSSFGRCALLAGALMASAVIVILLLLQLFRAGQPSQLVAPHLLTADKLKVMFVYNLTRVGEQLGQDFPLFLGAIFAFMWGIYRRQKAVILPLIWFVSSVAILLFARPMQSHHRLMMSVPLAMAFAISLADAFKFFMAAKPVLPFQYLLRAYSAGTGLLAIGVSIGSIGLTLTTVGRQNQPMEPIVLAELISAPRDTWVMTDTPLFPFMAGLRVPPEIAVYSAKRVSNGEITPDTLLGVLDKYHPLYVLSARYNLPTNVKERVDRDYDPIPTTRDDRLLWRRKSVSPTTNSR